MSVSISCCDATCGVEFVLPNHVFAQAKKLGKERPFWCPNGHQQHFSESEADRTAKKLEEATRLLGVKRSQVARLEDEITGRERTVSYWKGIVTRLKRGRP